MKKFHRELLGLSAPRSGSRFLTRVLRSAGFQVGHECFKRQGTIGMFFAVEDVWYPGKHWNDDLGYEDESLQRRSHYEFDQVWHFVRDPRKVIPSLASNQLAPNVWCWSERHTGISCGEFPKKLRAMKFWVTWNTLIEQNEKIDLFFRIEDIDNHWEEMKRRLGISEEKTISDAIPRDMGTEEVGPRRTLPMTWDEMKSLDADVYREVREMAERYGYA